MTRGAYALDEQTVQWKCEREQKGEWWLKFSVQGSRPPLCGLASIPHSWWMQESCLSARCGSCRDNCSPFGGRVGNLHTGSEVHGRLKGWHGAQLCFHWLEAEQVKWSSVRLLSVEHNALLLKGEQSDVFPPFTQVYIGIYVTIATMPGKIEI